MGFSPRPILYSTQVNSSNKQTSRFNFPSIIRPFTHAFGVRILLDKQATRFQFTSSTQHMKTIHNITRKLDNDCMVETMILEYVKNTFLALVGYNSSIILKLNSKEFISMKDIVPLLCLNSFLEVGQGKNLLRRVSSQHTHPFQQDTIASIGLL